MKGSHQPHVGQAEHQKEQRLRNRKNPCVHASHKTEKPPQFSSFGGTRGTN